MNKLNSFIKLMRNKKELLNCIFFTLLTQVLITIIFIKVFYNIEDITHLKEILNSKIYILILFLFFIIGLILIFILMSSNLTYFQKYIVFIIFSLIEAFFIYLILSRFSNEVIKFAFYSTILIFISLFIIGLIVVYFGYDLGWIGILLFISLLILIMIQLISICFKDLQIYNKFFAVSSLIIFMLYIIYDTNNILLKYKNNYDFCIIGALDYYLDIINIFINLLRYSSD
jgi:FtsH-binding integral membrane protein